LDRSKFFIDIILRPHCGPGVESAANKNEYREYLLGVRAVSAYGWQPYHLHMPIFLKFWETQPPGSLRACPLLLPNWHKYLDDVLKELLRRILLVLSDVSGNSGIPKYSVA